MAGEAFTTSATEWAVFTAALSVIGKVVFDVWAEDRKKCSTAAALAGEIKAYLRNLDPPTLLPSLRAHAEEDRISRQEWLRTFPALPSGHPVFDKVADRIGTLPPNAAQRVSEAYNVVTGMRALLAGLAMPALVEASDEMQKARTTVLADMLERELARFPEVIGMLEEAAQPWHHRLRRWIKRRFPT